MNIRSRPQALFILMFAAAVVSLALMPTVASAVYSTPSTAITESGSGANQAAANPASLTASYIQSGNTPPASCSPACARATTVTESTPKTVVHTLPPGIFPDPQAAPKCTPTRTASAIITGTFTYTCPDNTKVGTETVSALVCGTGAGALCAPTTVIATVYNGEAGAADENGRVVSDEQGHLYVLTALSTGATGGATGVPNSRTDLNIKLLNGDTVESGNSDDLATTTLAASASVAGLGCSTTGLPAGLSQCDLIIYRIDFAFEGQTGFSSGHPLITNQTYCTPGTFKQVATSTASEVSTTTTTYSATGCDSLPFGPTLKLSLSSTKRGALPGVTGTVTANPGDQSVKQATITFPKGFEFSSTSTTALCPTASQGSGQSRPGCASNTIVGNATVAARQLPTSLFGNVYAGQSTTSGRVNLIADETGYALMVVRGSTGSGPNSLLNAEFTGLPNATFSSFDLRLIGGKPGLLKNSKFCKPYMITGEFTSHAGKTAKSTTDVNIRGCKKATASFTKRLRRGAHQALSMGVGSAGTVLNKVSFTVSGVRFGGGGASKAAAKPAGTLILSIFGSNKKVKLSKLQSQSKAGLTLKGTLDGKAISANIKQAKGGASVTFNGLPTTPVADNYLTGVTLKLSKGLVTVKRNCRVVTFKASATDASGAKATNPYKSKKPATARRRCR